ncbi:MAG: gamma-glutamyltransferase [Planctomycetes bacterium]|nr:gamma-glutamyltransferase [Planctomycetota bacterium]
MAHAQDRPTGLPFATRSEVIAPHAAAATSHPLATQAALTILQRGGNAIDAAIAANAVLALGEPTGSGLGGDLFAIVWDASSRRLLGLNGSGRSPGALTRERLLAELGKRGLERIPPTGVLPISVPGAVDGWCALHARLGRMPLAEVLAPAIAYAEDGIPVPPVIASYWAAGRRLATEPGFAAVFLPGGEPPRAGERFRNPALARTLARIADGGRDAFYSGDVAARLAGFVQEHGGFLTVEDLAAHHAEWVEPVSTTYRGVEVFELPPDGQGIAVLQILNLIEPYDVAAMGCGSADWIHLFTEAKKLAFEDRAHFYADPQFTDVPVERLISKDYAAERRRRLDLSHAADVIDAGGPRDGDTVYLATADSEGNMVSLIQSNYRGFGSGVTPPELGFCLQDRGELFDVAEGRANSYAPGKRPFHTIIPGFALRDGEPWLAFGVMGGAMQPQGHVQVLVNLLDFGMDLQEAGDAPRVRHDGSSEPTGERMTDGGELALESAISEAVLAELRRRGHRTVRGGSFGGYQAILWDREHRVFRAASESRKDGQAAGY